MASTQTTEDILNTIDKGRSSKPPKPWLGVHAGEVHGGVFIANRNSPCHISAGHDPESGYVDECLKKRYVKKN
jgi:hypothetical protein